MAWWDFYKLFTYAFEEDQLANVDPEGQGITMSPFPDIRCGSRRPEPKRVLITGIGGFVGSHFLNYFLNNTQWDIVGIDSFNHKGTCLRITENVPKNQRGRVNVYTHDLTVPIDEQLENLLLHRSSYFKGYPIDYIINLAANSAVERSSSNPKECLHNNYEIAITMLELARRLKPTAFIQFSTDEVYGEAPIGTSYKEWAPLQPSNPYAASKAAQEMVAMAYWRTYNVPVVITNAMNIIGERQDREKFLPKLVSNIMYDEDMPIYGTENDLGIRGYQHAYNVASAIHFILEKDGEPRNPKLYTDFANPQEAKPDRYNIEAEVSLNNLQLGLMVADLMKKKLKYHFVPPETARVGYDRRYAIDGSKLRDMGWNPPMTFEESLKKVVDWGRFNYHWL